jgi:bifunctional DNase/RNase
MLSIFLLEESQTNICFDDKSIKNVVNMTPSGSEHTIMFHAQMTNIPINVHKHIIDVYLCSDI